MLDEYYAIMTMSIPTSMKTPEMLFFFYLKYASWSEFSIIHTRLAGRAHFAPLLVYKLWKSNRFARYDKNSLYSLVNKIIQYKRNGNWLLLKMCFDKNNPAIHVCVNQILKDVKKKIKKYTLGNRYFHTNPSFTSFVFPSLSISCSCPLPPHTRIQLDETIPLSPFLVTLNPPYMPGTA